MKLTLVLVVSWYAWSGLLSYGVASQVTTPDRDLFGRINQALTLSH